MRGDLQAPPVSARAAAERKAARMLLDGLSERQVTAETGLTREDLVRLVREVPGMRRRPDLPEDRVDREYQRLRRELTVEQNRPVPPRPKDEPDEQSRCPACQQLVP